MKFKTLLKSAAVVLALSSVAYAEPDNSVVNSEAPKVDQSHNSHRSFGEMRSDHRMEFHSFLEAHKTRLENQFKEFDLNGDGILTMDELDKAAVNSAQKIFSKLDKNRDGVISKNDRSPKAHGKRHGEHWGKHQNERQGNDRKPDRLH